MILFNTCAVREHAEQRGVRQRGRAEKAERAKPPPDHRHLRLHGPAETGSGQAAPELPLCGPGVRRGRHRPFARHAGRAAAPRQAVSGEPAQRNAVVEDIPIRRDSGFRAWLPIMYGCDNFCTYCIVPYVRGRGAQPRACRRPGRVPPAGGRRLQGDHPAGPERQQLRQGPGRPHRLCRPAGASLPDPRRLQGAVYDQPPQGRQPQADRHHRRQRPPVQAHPPAGAVGQRPGYCRP